MVPRVAQRGHSFKDAGLYYLHDKGALTTERVAWTHTHNLPTDNPEKAFRWMAHTSMSAERLKSGAGVARTGRKTSAGSVYSFSLAWHPEQSPEKEQMLNAAFETLNRFGLKDHQAVMVAHQETDHPHVHVICNLVNPNDGRTAVPSYDFLKFSTWAEEEEHKHDKIYCEERVKNNERRRNSAKKNRDYGLVKHREKKAEPAQQIQDIYNMSDSGKAFAAALNEAGFTLARGDRRGFVLVDKRGKIYSLSRQLQSQRAGDIKARLSDIDEKSLPEAQILSNERLFFDRDQYEVNWQNDLSDAALKAAQSQAKTQNEAQFKEEHKQELHDMLDSEDRQLPKPNLLRQLEVYRSQTYQSLAEEHDALIEWGRIVQNERSKFNLYLEETYRRNELVKKIETLQNQAQEANTILGRTTGRLRKIQEDLEVQRQSLENVDWRMEEARQNHEIMLEKKHPKPDVEALQRQQWEKERLIKLEAFRHAAAKDNPQLDKDDLSPTALPKKDLGKGQGLDYER